MPTSFTETLIIVVRAPIRDQANAIALVADPTTTSTTFVAKLRAASDNTTQTVTAYWSNWVMTPDQRTRLIAEFGRSAGNVTVYAKGANVPTNRDYWLFEAAEGTGWTRGEVLTELSLAPVGTVLS